jgi:hypothetical protein
MDIFTKEEQQRLATNPFTRRLVENFNSLEDTILDYNGQLLNDENILDRSYYINTTTIHRSYYINMILKRLKVFKYAEKTPDYDRQISDSVRNIITIYTRMDSSCDGLSLVAILSYYISRLILFTSKDYGDLHTLFLAPLLADPLFKPHLQDPLVMRFIFTCTVHNNEPTDTMFEPEKMDKRLNTFYSTMLELGRVMYWDFLEDMAERTAIYKEELIAAAWHPRRVEKWLEVGGFELLEAL